MYLRIIYKSSLTQVPMRGGSSNPASEGIHEHVSILLLSSCEMNAWAGESRTTSMVLGNCLADLQGLAHHSNTKCHSALSTAARLTQQPTAVLGHPCPQGARMAQNASTPAIEHLQNWRKRSLNQAEVKTLHGPPEKPAIWRTKCLKQRTCPLILACRLSGARLMPQVTSRGIR